MRPRGLKHAARDICINYHHLCVLFCEANVGESSAETRRLRSEPNISGTAWARFYLENRQSLTAYALALAGNADDAQDLIQDVLVQMVRGLRPVTNMRAYVLRCMRNLAIDRRRRAAARPVPSALDVDAAVVIDAQAAAPDTRETTRQVQDALQRLPSDYREVMVLKVYGKLTLREIAAVLDLPPGTVASHYRRGLEELRSLLSEVLEDVV